MHDLRSAPTPAPRILMSAGLPALEQVPLEVIDGALPDDLVGHVFVAALQTSPGSPAMSSEGQIYRFDLGDGGVRVTARAIRPPCSFLEEDLERRDANTMERFHQASVTRVSPRFGARSILNTAFAWTGERLLMTADSSRPWQIHPRTLALVTPIGAFDDYKPAMPAPWPLPVILTAAHPVTDPAREHLYSVNYTQGPPGLDLIRWSPDGMRHWTVVDDSTGEPVVVAHSMHQIAVTDEYIVLLDTAFTVEMRQMVATMASEVAPILGKLPARLTTKAQPDEAVFYVIARRELSEELDTVRARRHAVREEANHFAAVRENPDGKLTLLVLHSPTQDASEWIREGEKMIAGNEADPALCGWFTGQPLKNGFVGVHDILPDGSVTSRYVQDPVFTMGLGFNTQLGDTARDCFWVEAMGYDARVIPERLVEIYGDRCDAEEKRALATRAPVPSSVARFDLDGDRFDGYAAPLGWQLLAPTAIPRGGSNPRDAYLLALAFRDPDADDASGYSGRELWFFDGADIARGPLCRLTHTRFRPGMVLHTQFLSTLVDPPEDYRVDLDADYAKVIDKLKEPERFANEVLGRFR